MEKKYIEMLRNDKLYDKKSLIYYEGIIEEVIDEFDSDQIMEGRLGEFPVERIKTIMGVPLMIPLTKDSRVLLETEDILDTENMYQIRTETRFLCLVRCSLTEIEKKSREYIESEKYISVYQEGESEKFIGFCNLEEYGEMLGLVSIIRGKKDSYIFKYAGIGNFTDIRMEQRNILSYICRRVK